MLWKQKPIGLGEKTLLYRKTRLIEFTQSHKKFCKALPVECMPNLMEWVSRMALEISPPESDEGKDKQLFDTIIVDEKEIAIAINPVARHAMLKYSNKF